MVRGAVEVRPTGEKNGLRALSYNSQGQEASATPAILVHQQQQGLDHNRSVEALVAVQDLERQRLGQLTQDQVGGQLQSQQPR